MEAALFQGSSGGKFFISKMIAQDLINQTDWERELINWKELQKKVLEDAEKEDEVRNGNSA